MPTCSSTRTNSLHLEPKDNQKPPESRKHSLPPPKGGCEGVNFGNREENEMRRYGKFVIRGPPSLLFPLQHPQNPPFIDFLPIFHKTHFTPTHPCTPIPLTRPLWWGGAEDSGAEEGRKGENLDGG